MAASERIARAASLCAASLRTASLRAAGIALLAGIVAGEPAAAQIITESVDVPLVTVDVWIEDRAGQGVTGIDEADLRVLRDGRPITVSWFGRSTEDAVGQRSVPGPTRPGPARLSQGGSGLIVYLDLTFVEPAALAGGLGEVTAAVAAAIPSSTPVRLVVVDAAGVERATVRGFPASQLRGALAAAAAGSSPRRLLAEIRRIDAEIRRLVRQDRSGQSSRIRDIGPAALLSEVASVALEARAGVSAAAERLGRFVEAVSGLPGPPDLLVLGGSPPEVAAAELWDRWRNSFGRYSAFGDRGPTGPGDPAAAPGEDSMAIGLTQFEALPFGEEALDSSAFFRAVEERAAAVGVRTFTVELVPPGSIRGVDPTLPAVAARGALSRLAEATGGLSWVGGGAGGAWAESLADSTPPWRFAFVEPEPGDEVHRLEVEVVGSPVLQVRHRRTYRVPDRDRLAARLGLAALILETESGELGVLLEADGPARPGRALPGGEAPGLRQPMLLQVPLADLALVPDGSDHLARLSVFVTASTHGGLVAPVRKAELPVRVPNRELAGSLDRRIDYRFDVVLPPGGHRVAVVVRDDVADRLTSLSRPVLVKAVEGATE